MASPGGSPRTPWAASTAVAILTYAHILLGETVPKTLALQSAASHRDVGVAQSSRRSRRPCCPSSSFSTRTRGVIVRAVGVSGRFADEERYHSTEELQLIMQESQEDGLLRGESGQILRELFEFGDLTADQVMVPRVHLVAASPSAPPATICAGSSAHAAHAVSRSIRGDSDNIVGSVHIKDVLRHLVSGQPVADCDARVVPYMPVTMLLDEVLSAMRRGRSQMAVVMDEHGGTAGIVTIEDLFEEVVGEIDEGRGRTPISREASGRAARAGYRSAEGRRRSARA